VIRTLVTGYPSQENTVEAVNRGADDYIVKPYTMEDLTLRIREVIPRYRLGSQHWFQASFVAHSLQYLPVGG